MGGGRKGEKLAGPAGALLLLLLLLRRFRVTLGMRQILNGSCKVTTRRERARTRGRRRGKRREFIRALTWLASSHRIGLSPLLVSVGVCARPLSPFVTLMAREGEEEKVFIVGHIQYSTCLELLGIPCCSWRGVTTASIYSGADSHRGPVRGEWAAGAETRDSLGMSALRRVTSASGETVAATAAAGSGGSDARRRGRTRNELDFPFLSRRCHLLRQLGTIQTIFSLLASSSTFSHSLRLSSSSRISCLVDTYFCFLSRRNKFHFRQDEKERDRDRPAFRVRVGIHAPVCPRGSSSHRKYLLRRYRGDTKCSKRDAE